MGMMWSKMLLAAAVVVPAFAQNCSYSLSPSNDLNVPAGGGSRPTISVTAVGTNCRWSAASNVEWIHVTFGSGPNSNSGSFGYGVDPNSGAQRTGTITVAGLTFTVSQVSCSFTLVPPSMSFPATGGPGSLAVQTGVCTWNATTTSDWITIQSGSGGPGSGTITYAVGPNSTTAPRNGIIAVGAQQFSVSQSACSVALNPLSASLPSGATTGSFQVTGTPSTCPWTAQSTVSWITVTSGTSGSVSGTVGYAAAANTGSQRTGVVQVNNQGFSITQAGLSCSYTVAAGQANFGAQGGTSAVSLATSAGCTWTAATSVTWIALAATSGSGPANINFTVAANTGPQRTGTLTIGGQTITVTEADGSAPAVTLASVKNAASYVDGTVSAGEVVTLLGVNIGPLNIVQYDGSSGSLATVLAGTRVLFDGVAAPMVYTLATQASAVVPYAVNGASSTRVQVEYQGTLSNALTIAVAPAVPGIFSIDATGAGQGAVLNQDYSVNGPDNPAPQGSIVQIFATGGGQTDPAATDGLLSVAPFPSLILPVTVQIAGMDAPVSYAGAAPGLVAGMVQVNAQLPDNLPAGAVSVVLQVGSAFSQGGITIAVAGQ